jgi:hypothetical protein
MYLPRIFFEEWRSSTKSVTVGSLWAESYVVCFVDIKKSHFKWFDLAAHHTVFTDGK